MPLSTRTLVADFDNFADPTPLPYFPAAFQPGLLKLPVSNHVFENSTNCSQTARTVPEAPSEAPSLPEASEPETYEAEDHISSPSIAPVTRESINMRGFVWNEWIAETTLSAVRLEGFAVQCHGVQRRQKVFACRHVGIATSHSNCSWYDCMM